MFTKPSLSTVPPETGWSNPHTSCLSSLMLTSESTCGAGLGAPGECNGVQANAEKNTTQAAHRITGPSLLLESKDPQRCRFKAFHDSGRLWDRAAAVLRFAASGVPVAAHLPALFAGLLQAARSPGQTQRAASGQAHVCTEPPQRTDRSTVR